MRRRDRKEERRGRFPDDRDAGARENGRLRPDEPESWRDVVRSDYEYPEELDELGRRDRRRAKRTWRRDDHAQRMAWLRQQRQAEPTSPVTIVVVVIILAIVVLGLGGGLPRILGGDESSGEPIGLLTPTAGPTQPGATVTTTEQSPTSAPSATNSTPPILTERPPAASAAATDEVVKSWARTFYTRDPAAEAYADLVGKTAPYVTDEVAESLIAAGDTTYEALKTSSGKSAVAAITVTPPRPESAPVDTPTRISRLVNITIDVTGNEPRRIQLPLLVTLVPEGSTWVISDMNGGAGP
ncbi:hypothetical protein FB561_4239 [Kribbella amoyensis]|uniref:Uncharacterized protein n=1 Tax=Kribbella amoyensis TaxID=996641 RepID=A0A561BW09_9ACTN|nr:hypothetical protein [Kribbella amoyensis]TWD83084.1 hypothetical protein FB561_4239 [Kribbella amoyensis]